MLSPRLEHPSLVLHGILTQQLFLEEAKKSQFCKDFLILLLPRPDLLINPSSAPLCFITWGSAMKNLRPLPPNPSTWSSVWKHFRHLNYQKHCSIRAASVQAKFPTFTQELLKIKRFSALGQGSISSRTPNLWQ